MEAMNEQKASDESKRKMLEMLTNLEEHDRDAQSDLETEDLEERLGEIDINNADPEAVWSALTDRVSWLLLSSDWKALPCGCLSFSISLVTSSHWLMLSSGWKPLPCGWVSCPGAC